MVEPASPAAFEAMVHLIESMTGREVKLVPPVAYVISGAPAPKQPTKASTNGGPTASPVAMDVVVPLDLMQRERATSGPLTVDVTALLDGGPLSRVRLGQAADGGMAAFRPLEIGL